MCMGGGAVHGTGAPYMLSKEKKNFILVVAARFDSQVSIGNNEII